MMMIIIGMVITLFNDVDDYAHNDIWYLFISLIFSLFTFSSLIFCRTQGSSAGRRRVPPACPAPTHRGRVCPGMWSLPQRPHFLIRISRQRWIPPAIKSGSNFHHSHHQCLLKQQQAHICQMPVNRLILFIWQSVKIITENIYPQIICLI